MYKKLIIVIILLYVSLKYNPLFSQKDTSQYFNKTLSNNNFSIELGGKAIFYSIGYERTIYRSQKIILSATINLNTDLTKWIIPIGLNLILGKKENKLLFGLCETNQFDSNPYPKTKTERQAFRASGQYNYPPYRLLFIIPSIGYRRYFKKGNSLSVVYTYLIYGSTTENFIFSKPGQGFLFPWFGINYNFKF